MRERARSVHRIAREDFNNKIKYIVEMRLYLKKDNPIKNEGENQYY